MNQRRAVNTPSLLATPIDELANYKEIYLILFYRIKIDRVSVCVCIFFFAFGYLSIQIINVSLSLSLSLSLSRFQEINVGLLNEITIQMFDP